jgi:hypothetical protein
MRAARSASSSCRFKYRVHGAGQTALRPDAPVTAPLRPAALMRPACASACRRQLQPAHDGHRLASLTALRRLRLDRVWWLVTPGNPLKDNARLPSLAERIHQAENVAGHPASTSPASRRCCARATPPIRCAP